MDLLRAEIKTLAATTTTPDFESTIARFEDSGRPLGQAQSFFNIYTSTMNDKAMKAVEKEMTPILAALNDEIIQNEPLFKRIKTVYQARESSGLNPEQQRLTQVHYTRFERQGANLDKAQKTQLAALNKRLASLYTTFSQNQLADEEDQTMVLESEADLAGLSDDLRAGAAAAAEDHGQKGKWVLTNTRSSVEPFLTFSTRRDLREKAWRMWTRRGDNPNAHNNKTTIAEIVQLRTQRAKLLGYPSHVTGSWPTSMASAQAAMALGRCGAAGARSRGSRRHAEARRPEGAKITIEPWDYRFCGEGARRDTTSIRRGEAVPALDKIREACSGRPARSTAWSSQVDDVPVYHWT
jgi:peptidyl-dipeptidase Dcp